MTAIGIILLFVGAMALVGGLVQKMRAGRLVATPFAPTGQVAAQGRTIADKKGSISTQGQIMTQQLLTSPISGAPCVYYQMRLETEWGEKGAEQKHKVHEEFNAVQFAVNDGSGPLVVSIDAKRGGEFCSTKPFTRKKFSRGLMATMQAKPIEVTPMFSIPAHVQVPGVLGRMIDVPLTATYYVTEEFLEPKGPVYVNGKLMDDGSIGSPSWTSLLIQNKSRDELLGAAAGLSKKALIGGAVLTPIGIVLLIIGLVTAPAEAPAVANSAVPTTATALPGPAVPVPTPVAAQPTVVTSSLALAGDCSALGLDLGRGMIRVGTAADGVNVTALVGPILSRVFVKLGSVTPGQTVPVCAIGRRCTQNIQLGVGQTVYINTGHVGGTITVNEYNVAAGRMNLMFNGVTLPMNQGAGQCMINGMLATAGLTP
ncbi:MAG: hypothetical protein WCJ30_00515 [Deltaproteobacteria bacterium]